MKWASLRSSGDWESRWWGQSLIHPAHLGQQVSSCCCSVGRDYLLRNDFVLKHAMEALESNFGCRGIWAHSCQGWSGGGHGRCVTDCRSRRSSFEVSR